MTSPSSSQQTSPSGVVRLSPSDAEQVEALARLHAELLPRSAPAQLGHRFMTRFYFRSLPEAGLIHCDLYRHEGVWAGFCTYTEHPGGFMGEALRRNLASLCWLGLRIVVEEPRRLAALLDLVRKSRQLGSPPARAGRAGFWLTFGVLEPYRRVRVDAQGTRISGALVRAMLDHFRAAGFAWLDGAVERSNRSAILFYHSLGFRIEDPGSGSDLKVHYEFGREGSRDATAARGET
jgi:GNAT superfamily N-acetyltransferase